MSEEHIGYDDCHMYRQETHTEEDHSFPWDFELDEDGNVIEPIPLINRKGLDCE